MDSQLRDAIEQLLRVATDMDELVGELQMVVRHHAPDVDHINAGCMDTQIRSEHDAAIEKVRYELRRIDLAELKAKKLAQEAQVLRHHGINVETAHG